MVTGSKSIYARLLGPPITLGKYSIRSYYNLGKYGIRPSHHTWQVQYVHIQCMTI